jgi:hypothetical protein
LCTDLRIGGDAARIVVRGAGDQPRTQKAQKPTPSVCPGRPAARDPCCERQWCPASAVFRSAHSCNASGNGKPNSNGIARPWNH